MCIRDSQVDDVLDAVGAQSFVERAREVLRVEVGDLVALARVEAPRVPVLLAELRLGLVEPEQPDPVPAVALPALLPQELACLRTGGVDEPAGPAEPHLHV